jgi:hypothetical protein
LFVEDQYVMPVVRTAGTTDPTLVLNEPLRLVWPRQLLPSFDLQPGGVELPFMGVIADLADYLGME